jgi:hypothetical protein
LLEHLSTDVFVLRDTVGVEFTTAALTALHQFGGVVLLDLNSVLTVYLFYRAVLEVVAPSLVSLISMIPLIPLILLISLRRTSILLFGRLPIILFSGLPVVFLLRLSIILLRLSILLLRLPILLLWLPILLLFLGAWCVLGAIDGRILLIFLRGLRGVASGFDGVVAGRILFQLLVYVFVGGGLVAGGLVWLVVVVLVVLVCEIYM